jgi:hypothetical protein
MQQSWLNDFIEEEELTVGDRVVLRYNEGDHVVTVTGTILNDPTDPRPRLITIVPDTDPGSGKEIQEEDRLVLMQISFAQVIASMTVVTKDSFLASLEDEE